VRRTEPHRARLRIWYWFEPKGSPSKQIIALSRRVNEVGAQLGLAEGSTSCGSASTAKPMRRFLRGAPGARGPDGRRRRADVNLMFGNELADDVPW
jgi:hypothetical protein